MAVDVVHITFDCADTERVARFWAAAQRRTDDPGSYELYASIGHEEAAACRPAWLFV